MLYRSCFEKQKCNNMETQYSQPLIKTNNYVVFSLHIPLIYKHLFYKYFVCWYVGQATKDKNVKTWKFSVVHACFL